MEADTDTYRTLEKPSKEILLKEKKSKFYGYAFPLASDTEVKSILTHLKAKHSAANHFCYAWKLGVNDPQYRTNDDGEPNNSAGMPIYGQLKAFDITNALVVIVRIFGGTKLGVGGLISAYKLAAQMTLESSTIIRKTIDQKFSVAFGYAELDIVMRTIKRNRLYIVSQKMGLNCKLILSIRKRDAQIVLEVFKSIPNIIVKKQHNM